jgi:DNA primase
MAGRRQEGRGIAEDDILKVRDATSLVDLFEEITQVKKSGGSSYMALCPFHGERTASLHINEAEGLYYCFGCQRAGDAVRFIQDTKHVGFREAIQLLADRAGITVTIEESEEATAARRHRRQLHDTVDKAADWYHEQLLTSPGAGEARGYLRGRGVSGEMVRRFNLGWAPGGRESVVDALKLPRDLALESGVSVRADNGRTFDKLRSRIIFPICDPSGNAIALAGRVLPGVDAGAKYMNFAETPLYQKRRVIFGLHLAKPAIVGTEEVVVCEGQMDVVGCHTVGVVNAVATCGIALTDEHTEALARFAKRIVIAFDADNAGQGAIERLHGWERKFHVSFAVAELPEGEDPGSLAEKGEADVLREAIARAKPLLGWRLGRLFAAADLDTPESRVAAADRAMEMILEHPDSRVAEQYVSVVAERTGVDPAPLRQRVSRNAESHRTVRDAPSDGYAGTPGPSRLELEVLRLAIHDPDAAAEWFAAPLFGDLLNRHAAVALEEAETVAEAASGAPFDVGALISRLVVEEQLPVDADELHRRMVVAAAERARDSLTSLLRAEPERAGELMDAAARVQALLPAAREGDAAALGELGQWAIDHTPPLAPLDVVLGESEVVLEESESDQWVDEAPPVEGDGPPPDSDIESA